MWQSYSNLRLAMNDLVAQPDSLAKRIEIAMYLEEIGDIRFIDILKKVLEQSLASQQGLESLWAYLSLASSKENTCNQEQLNQYLLQLTQTFASLLSAEQSQNFFETPSIEKAEELLASEQQEEKSSSHHLIAQCADQELAHYAVQLCAQDVKIKTQLKPIPFFSAFSSTLLQKIIPQLKLKTFEFADILVEEGEQSLGLYLLCSGKVNISRRNQKGDQIDLATLSHGAVVGEMALLTNSPRVATVTAKQRVQSISLLSDAYPLIEAEKDTIKALLSKQVGARMLQNLIKCSPIFQSISKESQQDLLNLFESEIAQAGDILVAQGKPGKGLFLILDGLIKINRRGELQYKWLREGDVFGEISLLNQSPATATCSAVRKTLLYRLSPEKFSMIKDHHPEVIQILSELSLYRSLDELYSLI
jgi:CRP-like cAMP-binding protein